MSFCRISPSVGDGSDGSDGDPGGRLASWHSGGSHLHLYHLESKERKHNW